MIGTFIVASILVVVVGLIIFNHIKNKKQGKTSCGCGCSGCSMSDVCHPEKQ